MWEKEKFRFNLFFLFDYSFANVVSLYVLNFLWTFKITILASHFWRDVLLLCKNIQNQINIYDSIEREQGLVWSKSVQVSVLEAIPTKNIGRT